ncbi:diguanylate cyclase [Niveibacterium terrae]|uniref:sensor domain-containing diguanylate cyclase n=1 Tax=Niveibacterium terrae TaxID=3373598 RepID=UPI003A8D67F4
MSPNPDLSSRLISVLQRNFPAFGDLWARFPDNLFVIRCEEDGGFTVVAINPAQQKSISLLPRDVVGLSIEQVAPPEYLGGILAHYRECVACKTPLSYEESTSEPSLRTRHWQTLLVPSVDRKGRVAYILGVSRDITAVRATEEALRRANEELEKRVAERTAELEEANARLLEQAIRDGLTGLYNRRHFFALAAREFGLAIRHTRPMSVLMIDLDHFKKINDRFGHAAGDHVLQSLAMQMGSALRQSDLLGRYGGEEFAALLTDTVELEARRIAERLRAEVATAHIHWGEHQLGCTLSLGIAHMDPDRDVSIEALIERADQALLRAKRSGRNRMELSA